MGIILSTISTFFSIINKLVLIINVIFLVGFILSVVYLGPKFKIIFDAFTSLQEFNTKLTDISGSVPPCIKKDELDTLKLKMENAKKKLEELKKLPGIGGLVPDTISTSIDAAINNFKIVPLCE
jgi:hypothetical protein